MLYVLIAVLCFIPYHFLIRTIYENAPPWVLFWPVCFAYENLGHLEIDLWLYYWSKGTRTKNTRQHWCVAEYHNRMADLTYM